VIERFCRTCAGLLLALFCRRNMPLLRRYRSKSRHPAGASEMTLLALSRHTRLRNFAVQIDH
jgi:hypothetical protein